MLHRVLICFYCLFVSLVMYGQEVPNQIYAIHFEGLKKSKPAFLFKFIKSQVGAAYDSALVKQDEQALRNLLIFNDVSSRVDTLEKGINITFQCVEVISFIPALDFGGVSGNQYVQVGAFDYNFLGQRALLGGHYRFDGRHSFQVIFNQPFIRNSNWGIASNFSRLATEEPLFFATEDPLAERIRLNYRYDNYTSELLGSYTFRIGHHIQAGGAYVYERYRRIDSTELMVPTDQALHKLILKLTYTYQKLDFFWQYLDGFSQEFFAEAVATFETEERFWKLLSISRYYKRIGQNGNFASRVRLGVSPTQESPFVPFVLDSYINIRGSGNRVARGTSEIVVNAEYRHTFFWRRKIGAIQGVAFMDGGTWRIPDGSERGLFDFSNQIYFYGVGVRFYFVKAYNFVLRADYGINMEDTNERGLVLGVGQYF